MTTVSPHRPARRARHRPAEVLLETVLTLTGAGAVVGGLLLAVRPDGSLLAADPQVLRGTPFDSWRAPGLLLTTLVGAGFLGTAAVLHRGHRHARRLAIAAGLGLVAFEAAEFGWLGFQPLELVFAAVGGLVAVLATGSEGSS
jgi:hypothetical protein